MDNSSTAKKEKTSIAQKFDNLKNNRQFANDRRRWVTNGKQFLIGLFCLVIIIGVSYVILGPIIGILSRSFFSDADNYNSMVYMIPQSPTLERYKLAITYLDYWATMGKSLLYALSLTAIQILICSMVGYGFARYEFPGKGILFGCVVIMIVLPTHTIMLPLYMTFSQFDIFGIIKAIRGEHANLLSSPWPMYILTLFGCGLRSGLYIYIFNQFFRGLPKEIEEAAYVDGASTWYTYFRIMLVNAMPSVITVAVFSMVWQFNDTFYSNLFQIDPNMIIAKKISTIEATISNVEKIMDTNILELYVDAGIILMIIPIIAIYLILQKRFVEGVERSGIVG